MDENGLLKFQFNTLSEQQLYYYIVCLEETGTTTGTSWLIMPACFTACVLYTVLLGAITLVNEGEEMADLVQLFEERTVFPSNERLLKAVIPPGIYTSNMLILNLSQNLYCEHR